MKYFFLVIIYLISVLSLEAQLTQNKQNKNFNLDDEGQPVYKSYFAFLPLIKTNGYGFAFEKGFPRSSKNGKFFTLEFTEVKNPKELYLPKGKGVFGNNYIYGKANYFYPIKLGYGEYFVLGKKANWSGVSITSHSSIGAVAGLVRPYYIKIANSTNTDYAYIKYADDPDKFLNSYIYGSGGLTRGWSELKFTPGIYANSSLRFDYAKADNAISAIEIGLSAIFMSDDIKIMEQNSAQSFFMQAHVALVFGNRK